MYAKTVEIAWHDNSPIWSVDISVHNRVVTASGDKVARIWRFHHSPFSLLSEQFNPASFSVSQPSLPQPSPQPSKPPSSAHAPSGIPGSTSVMAPSLESGSDQTSKSRPTPFSQSQVASVRKPSVRKGSKPTTQPKLSKLTSIKLDASLVDWLCDLRAHATTINIARFSPSGLYVATAADMGEIVLWCLDTSNNSSISPFMQQALGDDEQPKERWQRDLTLRGHVQDVLDLAWSADGAKLVSASVDNTVMLWRLDNKSTKSAPTPVVLRNHSNFVQGVSVDPLGRLIASMGNDRALRIFTSTSSDNNWAQVASVSSLQESKLFVDDSKFKNFFRRLHWSPDGSVLACPSGTQVRHNKQRAFAVHIFIRNRWNAPVVQCGGLPTPPCSVRFNPVLFQLRGKRTERKGPFKGFSYRMIFAVACVHSVLFYDTERLTRPFSVIEGLHCAEQTDITWSGDGMTCLVSSVDGYISSICFSEYDLGIPLLPKEIPSWLHRSDPVAIQESVSRKIDMQRSSQQLSAASPRLPTSTVIVKPKLVPKKPMTKGLPTSATKGLSTSNVRSQILVPETQVTQPPNVPLPQPPSQLQVLTSSYSLKARSLNRNQPLAEHVRSQPNLYHQPVEQTKSPYNATDMEIEENTPDAAVEHLPIQLAPVSATPQDSNQNRKATKETNGKKRTLEESLAGEQPAPTTSQGTKSDENNIDGPSCTTKKATTPQGYRISPSSPSEAARKCNDVEPVVQQAVKKLKLTPGASGSKKRAKAEKVQTKLFFGKPKTVGNMELVNSVVERERKLDETPRSNTVQISTAPITVEVVQDKVQDAVDTSPSEKETKRNLIVDLTSS